MRRPGRATVFLIAALLVGCTAKFTYNHLDWLIPWYVDGYVDLSREQRQVLQVELEPLLRWHREQELTRYVDLLDRIERDLLAPVTAATVQQWVEEIVSAVERTEQSMLLLALEFGATLSDAQMAEFVASLWQHQREFENEFLSRDQERYQRDSYDSLADLLRRFLGRLDADQQRRLRTAAAELRRFDNAWLEERSMWLRELEPLLQRHDGWQQEVQRAYAARKQRRTPRYHEYLDHNLRVVTGAVADVLNARTPKQQRRMAVEFEDLRDRLRDLAAKPQLTLEPSPQ